MIYHGRKLVFRCKVKTKIIKKMTFWLGKYIYFLNGQMNNIEITGVQFCFFFLKFIKCHDGCVDGIKSYLVTLFYLFLQLYKLVAVTMPYQKTLRKPTDLFIVNIVVLSSVKYFLCMFILFYWTFNVQHYLNRPLKFLEAISIN